MEQLSEFIGTKRVLATAMNRLQYNQYRGWELPGDEDGEDLGYLVEYLDGGKPNHPNHEGYLSWSPKAQFDNAYEGINSGVGFGHALEYLKAGKRMQRSGWNGAGMWVDYIPAHGVDLPYLRLSYPVNSRPYPEGARVAWVPSQTDMLATDWLIRL
jgi:hypothetical protein